MNENVIKKAMRMNPLGNTGIDVSEISFGTVSLGLPYGLGVNNETDMLPEQESIALLRSALEQGINFYDTALSYGKSESIVGRAFQDCREKAIICSKPAHVYDSFAGQALPSDAEIKRTLESSVQNSLAQLGTDYIDIYMSHSGTEEVIENETVIEFFQQLKKKGIIRATGVSVYTPAQSLKAIDSGVWDVIQLGFNLMDQTQLPMIERAEQKGVGIVVRSVLFKGVLTDRGQDLHPAIQAVQQHRQKYLSLLNGDVKTLADLATKFVLSTKGVSSVLVGIDRPEYLDQSLEIAGGNVLDEETLTQAQQMAYPDPDFLDLPKWARMGWL